MTCSKKEQREVKRVDQNMYELRKWINKPLLKEIIYPSMSFEELNETVVELCEKGNISSRQEFFDLYEIEELETGLKNNEVL
ncbi:MAG: hypothetical protein J6P09_01885 [Methanobrevibacter sp.]|nr:hypothetical protein [Methanobrevibacter sp.]MBP3225890.1 hypothetical protein [Methanobrevibacter sp.]